MQKKISGNIAIILVLSAVFVDIAQAFLEWMLIGFIVNPFIIDPCALAGYWFIFRRLGVNFTKTRGLIFFGLALFEFFPAVEELPLWTLDVLLVILMSRAESALGKSAEDIVTNEQSRNAVRKSIIKGVKLIAKKNVLVNQMIKRAGFDQDKKVGKISDREALIRKQLENNKPHDNI